MMTAIAISSGHGLYVAGASGSPIPPQLSEVETARRFVDRVAQFLEAADVAVYVIHDNQSHNQSDNLDFLVSAHNATTRNYDISIHLNYYDSVAHGCEVLYVSDAGHKLADNLVDAICEAGGFTNRGAKYRDTLAWLNGTHEPACLIELAFCDHTGDCLKVVEHEDAICRAIAGVLAGESIIEQPPTEPPEWPEDLPPAYVPLFQTSGKVSHFGGPNDSGVSSSEGLAFLYPDDLEEYANLFLPFQPEGTTGLARRLNPGTMYCAARWPYDQGGRPDKNDLRRRDQYALVRAHKNGRACLVAPTDWGPHATETDKAIDLSPGAMLALDLESGDEATLIYPAPLEMI
jgi:hypothetical protein